MYFYRIDSKIISTENDREKTFSDEECYAKVLRTRQSIHRQNDKNGTLFIASIDGNDLVIGALARDTEWLGNNLSCFLAASEIECCDTVFEEITFSTFRTMLRNSRVDDYMFDSSEEEIYRCFGLGKLVPRGNIVFSEYLLKKPLTKSKMIKKADDLLCAGALVPELERIYQLARETITGHPVHYFIQCDNSYLCDNIFELLISALYANGRLGSRRYCVASMNEKNVSLEECTALYEACTDAVLVIKCGEKVNGEINAEERLLRAIFGGRMNGDEDRDSDAYWLSTVCQTALKFRDKTLTIFCLPRTSERVKVSMREQLDIMTLVDLTEDFLDRKQAKAYMNRAARSRGVYANKALYAIIDNEQTSFSSTELQRGFDVWYSRRLKNFTYPQYASFASSSQISGMAVYRGDAYNELCQLVGLHEAKSVINRAVDYFRVQKLLSDRGVGSYRPSMHMMFTGSPGTAKTTVARLLARIMRENELLSVGKLYEVGRADLVGKYVGWTAHKVESKFNEAMGSVLFIDEAYSLVDDRDGCYGDEAISTIVSEMENRREDLVVIFAGYPEKMETFLLKNSGLRSRIAFHVPFPDYSTDELYQILLLTAKNQSLILDDSVRDRIIPILSAASREPDLGNGRFVRSIIEQARMKQAGRLLAMDIDRVTAIQATTLIADDFETPPHVRTIKRQIGFSVA